MEIFVIAEASLLCLLLSGKHFAWKVNSEINVMGIEQMIGQTSSQARK